LEGKLRAGPMWALPAALLMLIPVGGIPARATNCPERPACTGCGCKGGAGH